MIAMARVLWIISVLAWVFAAGAAGDWGALARGLPGAFGPDAAVPRVEQGLEQGLGGASAAVATPRKAAPPAQEAAPPAQEAALLAHKAASPAHKTVPQRNEDERQRTMLRLPAPAPAPAKCIVPKVHVCGQSVALITDAELQLPSARRLVRRLDAELLPMGGLRSGLYRPPISHS